VQIYKALRAALLVNKPKEYLAILMENLSAEDLAAFGHDAEPLLAFALNNHDNLRFLLDRQVPVDAANDFGKTALFYAIGVNDLEAVDILLRNKADVNHAYKSAAELRRNGDACIYPNLEHTKRTPLMHAAQHGDVALLKLLIKSGANLNALDDLGNDALAYAREAHENKNEVFLKSFKLKH
jgi:ankyrin repeat protein